MQTVDKVAPTAAEAVAQVSQQYTDKDTIVAVQRALLALGYVEVGPADGVMNDKTHDTILSFRLRQDLQLIPVIDDELLSALKVAAPKALPVEQVTATAEQIAPKVEVVKVADAVQKTAWWSKVWSFFVALPSGLLTLLGFVIDNIGAATNTIQPVRTLLFDMSSIPAWVWVALIVGLATIMAMQAMRIQRLSKRIAEAAVVGYQRGTIRNDVPPSV